MSESDSYCEHFRLLLQRFIYVTLLYLSLDRRHDTTTVISAIHDIMASTRSSLVGLLIATYCGNEK